MKFSQNLSDSFSASMLNAVNDVINPEAEFKLDEAFDSQESVDFIFEDISEDMELTELSLNLLRKYQKAAKEDPSFKKKRGPTPKATQARQLKRKLGYGLADRKINDRREKWSKESEAARSQEVHHVHKNMPKILAKHGYQKMAGNAHRTIYTKVHKDSGSMTTITHDHRGGIDNKDIHRPHNTILHARHSTGWQSTKDRYSHSYAHGGDFSHSKTDEKKQDRRRKKTGGNYHKPLNLDRAVAGVHDYLGKISKDHRETGAKHQYEEVQIDEARGRPPKKGSAAWKKRQEHGDDLEPRQHIMQQLERAKINLHGGGNVTFADNSTHHVKGHHAAKVLSKYATMKPFEKEKFQKDIGNSHANLSKHFR